MSVHGVRLPRQGFLYKIFSFIEITLFEVEHTHGQIESGVIL